MRILLLAFLLGTLTAACSAAELWKLVAQSQFIFVGELEPPRQQILGALKTGEHKYVQIPVTVERCLKSRVCPKRAKIAYYTQPDPDSPGPATLLAMGGKKVVLFLIEADGADGGRSLYFAGYSPDAIRTQSIGIEKRIQSEVAQQNDVRDRVRTLYDPKNDPVFERVRSLIDVTTSPDKQKFAFAEFDGLGMSAVPATIYLMDDRRKLAFPEISLRSKSPQAFEGIRHYGPVVVVDAMDAILEQVTGESFGNIRNGGTEEDRALAVAGWQTYLVHLLDKMSTRSVEASP